MYLPFGAKSPENDDGVAFCAAEEACWVPVFLEPAFPCFFAVESSE